MPIHYQSCIAPKETICPKNDTLLILKSEEFAHSVDRILIKDLGAILAYDISNILFEIGSHVSREILTLLLLPLKCWDFRPALPHLLYIVLGMETTALSVLGNTPSGAPSPVLVAQFRTNPRYLQTAISQPLRE